MIEEVFRGYIDKALEEGEVNESKEVEVDRSFDRMRKNYQIRWWIWPNWTIRKGSKKPKEDRKGFHGNLRW